MSEQPKVRTTEGVVQGRRRHGHAVFRGIPYAQPPVGMLRFAAPAPPHRWEGTRQAVEFGPVVPLSLPIVVSPQGTDWLTLNVGTPDPGAAGLPVLVWIPVGGYLSAASSDPMFDPAALTEAGVVVVTVNCRVGAEGFAFLDDAPPNCGFLDQIAALEWVQRNISAFGGDPGRVTVAGVSAGVGSVAALLTMKSARGLFRRAIAHSVPGLHSTPALARQVTAAFADRLGAAAPTAKALRDIDPWHLAAELTSFNAGLHAHRESWGRLTETGTALCPVVDGEVLPETPWLALTGARASGTELLVGHTRDEFRYFSVMSGRYGTFTEEDAHAALELLAPQPDGARAYRAAFPQAGPEELVETVYSDALFRMPSQKLAEANAAAGGTSTCSNCAGLPRPSAASWVPATASTFPWRSARWTAPLAPSSSARRPLPRPSRSPANSRKHGSASSPPATRAGPLTGPAGTSPASWTPSRRRCPTPNRHPARSGKATPRPRSISRNRRSP